uniref:H15 domain-containing protein n=1 Tax=Ascaris lumbricoides TaxID=6252 RepID=A0A0M3I4C1_ASCLU
MFRKINNHGGIMADRKLLTHLLSADDCVVVAKNICVAIREMHHRGSLEPAYRKKGLAASAPPVTSGNGDASSGNRDAKTKRFNRRKLMSRTLEEIEGGARRDSGICPTKNSAFELC